MPAIPNSVVQALFDYLVRPSYRNGHRTFALNLAALSVLVALTAAPAHAQSYDWAPMALVSDTMGIQANRLCVGEPTRGDIGCPDYAPSVTTAGLEVSGTVSATRFVGDGSGLTGIAANVSVTTGASGSLVFRDAYGSLMASSGLSISSTTGSVGIGSGAPASVGSYGLYVSNSIYAGLNIGVINGAVLGVSGGVALVRPYGSAATDISFSPGSNQPEVVRIVSSGYVGIGTSAPSSSLHVIGSSGGISGGIIIGATTGSAMRAALFPVGNNSTAMQIFNNTGGFYIKNKSGNNFALFDNDAGALMIGSGVNGNPSATLFVRGSTLTTSWTGINFSSALNVTPTAPLEVSGTISATALLINGQSVTGGAGTFASLTDVSYSAAGGNVFGPGSIGGAVNGVTRTTAIGVGALNNVTGASSANSAFGHYALLQTTSGSFNTAMGKSALQYNAAGSNNSAFGNAALNISIASSGNSALGSQAMLNLNGGSLNTAVGYSAGNGVSGSSNYNRASLLGTWAGQALTSGNENTLLGFNAGGGITSGSSNTVIGTAVSPYSNTGNNQLAIANAIWGDVGNGDTLRAKIGINVTSPTVEFDVSGTTKSTIFVSSPTNPPQWTTTNLGAQLILGGYRNPAIAFLPANGFVATVSNVALFNGQSGFTIARAPNLADTTTGITALLTISATNKFVGIGTSTPNAPLDVSGTVSATRFVGDGAGLTGITAAANDNIVSGSAYVRALQDMGASISGSLAVVGDVSTTGDIKANTLRLADAPTDACNTVNAGAFKRVGKRFYFCRP